MGSMCGLTGSRPTVSIAATKGSLLGLLLHSRLLDRFVLLRVDLNADLKFQESDDQLFLLSNGLAAKQGEYIVMSCLKSAMSITNLVPM